MSNPMDYVAPIGIIVVIGVPAIIYILRYRRSRATADRWTKLGWKVTPFPHPIRFENLTGMKKFVTRSVEVHGTSGAITAGSNPVYRNSSSTDVTEATTFIANPRSDIDLGSALSAPSTGTNETFITGLEFGNTDALDVSAWERVRTFVEASPLSNRYRLQFARNFLFISNSFAAPGPMESLAQIDYLGDVSLAAQGKPTSGINHKAALSEARKVDAIKWYKKDAYAAATRTDTRVASKGKE